MNDNDVREMLERRAGQATVSSDAWDRIAERIAEDGTGPTVLAFAPPRRRFDAAIVLGAIAAALLVLVASVAVIQSRDTAEKVRAADDGTSLPPVPDREPESGPPAAVTGLGQRPVWPATTDEGLARLQAEADAGQRPDLLDPRAVAGGYLSERFSDDAARRLAQNFAVDEFAEGDSTSGEVPYTSPPGASTGGTVLVRRAGGDGAIWFVVGSISRRVDIQVAAYDGKELTGEASVAGNGTLKVEIAATDGTDPLSSESRPVTAAKTIDLRQEFAGKPGLIVRLRLAEAPSGTVSFTEIRVDKLPTASPPPPPPTPQTFEAGAQAAARRWVRAVSVNDADVAWELLAADSRKTVGGRAGFDARFTELAGGWGAWDGAPDTSYRVVSLIDEGGKANLSADLPRLGVVVLSGRVAQEGATSFRTMSLPVRGTLDKIQIDPFTDINIELDKADGAGVGPRTVLGAYAPAGARVWFVLDGATPVGPDASEGADGDQQHATFTPALSPGRHSFTVVVLRVDGRVASRSATYTVT